MSIQGDATASLGPNSVIEDMGSSPASVTVCLLILQVGKLGVPDVIPVAMVGRSWPTLTAFVAMAIPSPPDDK